MALVLPVGGEGRAEVVAVIEDVWPMSAYWREVVGTVEALPLLVQNERKRRRLSLRDAAVEIGYAYADLCRFEGGSKQPTLPSVVNMLRWLAASERLSPG